jgi:Uncharacterized protein conserved in bacteria
MPTAGVRRARPSSVSVPYSSGPAPSPVNGRFVALAPCMPGARPTTSRGAVIGPKEGTGKQALTRMTHTHGITKIGQPSTTTTMRVVHTHLQTDGVCAALLMKQRDTWDLFCHVVDNFGDIGVG